MKSKTKRNILIAAIAVLILINLSAIGTLIYKNIQDQRPQSQQFERFERNRDSRDFDHKSFEQRLRNELQLNDEQFVQFKDERRKAYMESKTVIRELNTIKRQMMEELGKDNPSMEKLKSYSREIGDMHVELKIISIDHYFRLREICTPEQEKKLKEFYMRIFPGEPHYDRPRRQGQGRRGRD